MDTTETVFNELTLAEQVMVTRIEAATTASSVHFELTHTSEAEVPVASLVRQAGVRKLQRLRTKELDTNTAEELQSQYRTPPDHWPSSSTFKTGVLKRIMRKATGRHNYLFVCKHTDSKSKLHQEALKKLHRALQQMLASKLRSTNTVEQALDYIHWIERICKSNGDYVNRRRVQGVIAALRNRAVELVSSFDEHNTILHHYWVRNDDRKRIWYAALAMANSADRLYDLRGVEPEEGVCLRIALDRCITFEDHMKVLRSGKHMCDEWREAFAAKAIELASLDQLWNRGLAITDELFVRKYERWLNLCVTSSDLEEFMIRTEKLNSKRLIVHLRNEAARRYPVLRLQNIADATDFEELKQWFRHPSGAKFQFAAFERACVIASANDHFETLHRFKSCYLSVFDPVTPALDLAEANQDANAADSWIRRLDEDHPLRERAMRLYVSLSRAQ